MTWTTWLFGNMTSVIVRALALHIRNGKHITPILLASTPSSFGSEGSQLILGVAVNYARPQPKWDRCFEEDRFTCYPIQNSHLRSHTRKKHSVSRAQCRFFSASCFYSPWQWFYMPHQKRKNFKHFLNYLFVISTWYISLPNCFPFTKKKIYRLFIAICVLLQNIACFAKWCSPSLFRQFSLFDKTKITFMMTNEQNLKLRFGLHHRKPNI